MIRSEAAMAPFDPERLLALSVEIRDAWTKRDTMLYALGLGADELPFVYEEQLEALPMMAAVLGYPGFAFWTDPALGIDAKRILHGETEVLLHAPLPVEGDFVGDNKVEAIWDKGAEKGTVVRTVRRLVDGAGRPIATVNNTSVLRGNGGFGGSSEGQPAPQPMPVGRDPDETVMIPTAPNQALLYRLSGDYNSLHIDPVIAKAAGFPAPILHGLCTFGIAGRALLRAIAPHEPARLKAIGVRFSSPVFPGETIRTEIWREQEGRVAFRALVEERNLVVLNNGYAEFA
jgi:acyl dehydratase